MSTDEINRNQSGEYLPPISPGLYKPVGGEAGSPGDDLGPAAGIQGDRYQGSGETAGHYAGEFIGGAAGGALGTEVGGPVGGAAGSFAGAEWGASMGEDVGRTFDGGDP
jgi:hypothetical protein